MKKHVVFFIGMRTYLSDTEEQALKAAEQDLSVVHPNLNLEISGIREEE
jgi:hypothetical protein|tara:strand:- start:935 stop:1081 length:147 start_codon:yes stop_codon:yes gene_type:complete